MDPVLAQILIAVISAIPPTVAALVAMFAALQNGRKTDGLVKKAEGIDEKADSAAHRATVAREAAQQTAVKMDVVLEKLDENTTMTATIEKQTNGLVDKLRAEIAALKRQRDAGPGASQ